MEKLFKYPAIIIGTTLLLVSGIVMNTTEANQEGMTRVKVESWLKGYENAWETLDADKAAILFTEDATYQESPYKEPFFGRAAIHDYWSTVTSDQASVDFTYEVLSVTNNTGIAHWHSEFIQPSTGNTVILDGIFVLVFSKAGLCQSLKEWWHFKSVPAR